MRMADTPSCEFRALVKRVSSLIAMEALADAPLKQVRIETPVAATEQPLLVHDDPVVVPILRAGIGMLEGVTDFAPKARIGVLGMERNEETHVAFSYYCKLPAPIDNCPVLLIDPMLATGGTAVDCVTLLKDRGATDIRFLCIVAAPEGLKRFSEAHPDVPVYVGSLDESLNDEAYIVPGLGDAGDRIFDTIQCIR